MTPKRSHTHRVDPRKELNNLVDRLSRAADLHADIKLSANPPQLVNHRLQALLLSDTLGLLEGLRQGLIKIGQPRIVQNMLHFVSLSAPFEANSEEMNSVLASIQLSVQSAAELGITAESTSVEWTQSAGRVGHP